MSNPSFSNIDMWLFELAEGNLSPEQVEQLELFLLNNPDVDVDRDVWEMAKVEKQAIVYPNVADLERKRRPVALFAFAGLLLLLIGSGSYLAFNSQVDGFTEVDLIAQNELVKGALQKEIRNSNNKANVKKSINTDETSDSFENSPQLIKDVTTLVASTGVNSATSETINVQSSTVSVTEGMNSLVSEIDYDLDRYLVGNSMLLGPKGVNVNQWVPSEMSNLTNLQTQIGNQIATSSVEFNNDSQLTPSELLGATSIETQNGNQSVTNPEEHSYVTELNEELENSGEVGNKQFFVREPREIDNHEGRVWNERTSDSDGQMIAQSSGSERHSFKDRVNKFTRSLERMMNSPIALKNSRDPIYHVPGRTASDICFSSAGTLVATRFHATSRMQWQGQESEQFMNQVAIDGYSNDILGGWGIQLNHQWYKNGGIQVAQAAFTYSPKISVSNRVSVEPSVRFKMGNKQLNMSQLENSETVELDRGNAHEFYPNGTEAIGKSLWYKDLGLGLLVNTKWFFASIQTDNLFKHKDNLYDNNWSDPRTAQSHFTATIGTDWVSRNEKLTFSPYVVYQKNEKISELWAGANFSYNWFNIGLAASNNLEPAASIGMRFDHFSLHYNADYTKSEMLGKKALSHQLTLRFVAKQNRFGKQLFKR